MHNTIAIRSTKEHCLAKLGSYPGHDACILWRANCSMYKQEGIPYIQEPDEIQLPLDAQTPEVMERDIVPQHHRWQRGCWATTIRKEHKIIQSSVHGNCVVIYGYMYPLTDFLRGPLCKPTLEVQQRAAFSGLFDPHDTDIYHQVINSFKNDLIMRDLRTTVCLTIARVTPDES